MSSPFRRCLLAALAAAEGAPRKKAFDSAMLCLHCVYMNTSFPRSGRHPNTAFTLIELMVVVAIIAILAALALSTLGYVNKKGAESRARAEVAALSAAIESFKLDTGAYPANAAALYSSLCSSNPGAKIYFEPRPQMLMTNGSTTSFADPWGSAYVYSNCTSYFELWSTAGDTNNTNAFIRN